MEDKVKILERKNGLVLLFGGHQYYRHKVYKNKTVNWTCSNKTTKKCAGSLTLQEDEIVRMVEHKTPLEIKCVPDYAKNELAINVDKMKKEASTSVEPMPKIYEKYMTPLKMNKIDTIPKFESVKCCLYNCRKAGMDVNKTVFKCLCDVEVPLQFRTMLVADYNNEETRIIIFCNEESLTLIPNIKEYFVDSTFKSTPRPFYQLLSIYGDIGSTSETCHVVPIFYALMSDKKESSYHAIFDILNTRYDEWKPVKIHMDFEFATSNAIKDIFPDIIIIKCYYHYNKCIWKKSKSLNIKAKLYLRIVGLCAVLPLLPLDKISEGWNYIEQRCKGKDNVKLKLFMKYMKKTWLKNDTTIKEWCVTDERHRTNNMMENWHSVVNKAVNKNYVIIAKLLKELKHNGPINKNWASKTTRRRVEIEKDEELLDLKMQLIHSEITVGHFLETLSAIRKYWPNEKCRKGIILCSVMHKTTTGMLSSKRLSKWTAKRFDLLIKQLMF